MEWLGVPTLTKNTELTTLVLLLYCIVSLTLLRGSYVHITSSSNCYEVLFTNVGNVTAFFNPRTTFWAYIFLLFFKFSAEERNSKLSVEKSQLTDSVNELESEIAACHAKESELLDFMEKMTAKCTQLQSTLTVIQAQVCLTGVCFFFSNLRNIARFGSLPSPVLSIFLAGAH